MDKRFLSLGTALLLMGAGCASGIARNGGLISYTLPADQHFEALESTTPAQTLFTADGLLSLAEECGTAKNEEYYQGLIDKLAGLDAERYEFTYVGDVQAPKWTITAIPNVLGYADEAAFKEDFNICAAGAGLYPSQVSANTLLFISSCGTGYDDGSGREHGCPLLREKIEPTIVLD